MNDLFDLSGKTALITGATGYLGSAMAEALAEAGASVIISSRDECRARQAAAKLPIPGEAVHSGVSIDLMSDEEALLAGFDAALGKTGQLDILINNGHDAQPDDWSTAGAESFERQLKNGISYFLLARMLRNHVVSAGRKGSVVMLGSMYGSVGSYPDAYEGICPSSPASYHLLKGGIVHLTRHLAVYWAQDGVRVNCLSPGPFPSPEAPREMVERLIQKSPMARMGRPEELKGALLLLASEAGSYITGQNLLVDGGWTAW